MYIFISLSIFVLFKYFYPFPHFGIESDAIINAAAGSTEIQGLSYGYILLLRRIPFIARNDISLVFFQYCILQTAVLHLFYTINLIIRPIKWVTAAIFTLLLLNPLFINISNLLAPDGLFIAISICWFSNLLSIIDRISLKKIILTSILICLCNIFNNNSIWYVFISLGTVIFGTLPYKRKLNFVLVLISLPILSFICTTDRNNRIFPSTLGWELAGNALYAYYYTPKTKSEIIPSKFRELHDISNMHMDSIRTLWIRPDTLLGNYYEKNEYSPLRVYLTKTELSAPNKIYNLSSLYLIYGTFLISKHPKTYVKHFMWPNLIYYYTPTAEGLLHNNRGVDTISKNIQQWFSFKTGRVQSWNYNGRIPFMFKSVPISFAIVKYIFLILIICNIFNNNDILRNKYIQIIISIIITGSLFSIAFTPNTIRNQTFLIIIIAISDLLLLAALVKDIVKQSKTNINKSNQI